MDVFNAGLGTDSILINASNITALEQTINGVLGIIAQFYQVYGIGVGFTEDDIRFACI
jgi:hypothetical protein